MYLKCLKTIESIHKTGEEKYADESIKSLFTPKSFTSKKEEIEDVKEMILKSPEQLICDILTDLSAHKETCSRLSEIKAPMLILAGKEDIITLPAAARLS
jgi:vacuolar-type H+-ATPase subunit H